MRRAGPFGQQTATTSRAGRRPSPSASAAPPAGKPWRRTGQLRPGTARRRITTRALGIAETGEDGSPPGPRPLRSRVLRRSPRTPIATATGARPVRRAAHACCAVAGWGRGAEAFYLHQSCGTGPVRNHVYAVCQNRQEPEDARRGLDGAASGGAPCTLRGPQAPRRARGRWRRSPLHSGGRQSARPAGELAGETRARAGWRRLFTPQSRLQYVFIEAPLALAIMGRQFHLQVGQVNNILRRFVTLGARCFLYSAKPEI